MTKLSHTVFVPFTNEAFKRMNTYARTYSCTHARTHTWTYTRTHTRMNAIGENAIGCISLKNQAYRQTPHDISWREVSPSWLWSLLDIMAIGMVHCAYKDWSAFHADFTYELANVYDLNLWPWTRSRTLRICMKIGKKTYLANTQVCKNWRF